MTASDYASLREALADSGRLEDEVDLVRAGKMIILPSTFVGSDRYMQQELQDIMGVFTKVGTPDIFITMTYNPNWPEIQRHLSEGQTANSRPDIVTRVFRMKMKHMMREVIDNDVSGRFFSFVGVIGFHKRWLPHAYCIFCLSKQDKEKLLDP